MATEWYCLIDGTEYGPLTAESLRKMAVSGRLTDGSFVRKGTSSEWVPSAGVRGLYQTKTKVVDALTPPSPACSKPRTKDSARAAAVGDPIDGELRCVDCGQELRFGNTPLGLTRCRTCFRQRQSASRLAFATVLKAIIVVFASLSGIIFLDVMHAMQGNLSASLLLISFWVLVAQVFRSAWKLVNALFDRAADA
jgi:GYF domain 2